MVVVFSVSLLTPIVYAIALAVYKIVPKLWNTCIKKFSLQAFKGLDSIKGIHRDEDQEDVVVHHVADSLESDLLLSHQDIPRYDNSLLDKYTAQ